MPSASKSNISPIKLRYSRERAIVAKSLVDLAAIHGRVDLVHHLLRIKSATCDKLDYRLGVILCGKPTVARLLTGTGIGVRADKSDSGAVHLAVIVNGELFVSGAA